MPTDISFAVRDPDPLAVAECSYLPAATAFMLIDSAYVDQFNDVGPVTNSAIGSWFVSRLPEDGFRRNPQVGALMPYRRFVHATDVLGALPETPLRVPLSRALGWEQVQRLSQLRPRPEHADLITNIRGTATVRRGTRMAKVVSPGEAAGYLRGRLPRGFCFREYDIAHLRTPAELAFLGETQDEVAYVLRWRAVDQIDYHVPLGAEYAGLAEIPPHDRVGPPVLGSGFAPSERHVIPEFVTADLVDLPLPANASPMAYTADGTEVVLYTYQPEQRGWLSLVGPQWIHLVAPLPRIPAEQEYLPLAPHESLLFGLFRGVEYEAVADPPTEFRVPAMTRAARYPVEALARRTRHCTWRSAGCTVVRDEGAWLRVRLTRPDPENVVALGAQCGERGIYEAWAPTAEVTDRRSVDTVYQL